MRSQIISAIIVTVTLLIGIIIGILGDRAFMLFQMGNAKYFAMGPMPEPHFHHPPMPGSPFEQRPMLGPSFRQPPSVFFKLKLEHLLNPSEEQKHQIEEIIKKHEKEMLEIDKRHHQELEQSVKSVIDEVMPILTQEQKERLLKDYQMFKNGPPDTNDEKGKLMP